MESVCQQSDSRAFVYWQCQIRKFSVRKLQARPTSGIRPELFLDGSSIGIITTLIVPEFPDDDISHLKHAYQKTFDPNKRRENALKYLQSEFYQFPQRFNGELTALAAKGADWVKRVIQADQVELLFDQDSRQWRLCCETEILSTDDQRWQFTLAHNQLFNHTLTLDIDVILFRPVWDQAKSD